MQISGVNLIFITIYPNGEGKMVEKTKEWFDKKWLALAVSFGADFIGLFAMA